MKINKEHFEEIKPFDFQIKYLDIDSRNPQNVYDSHIHDECEIYINLSGDVSFVVENRIYPLKHGDIIITRPYEYHHCVYHSNKRHKHFWILFSSAGNENMLDIFFNRKAGESNLMSLSPSDTEALISLCHRMTEEEHNTVRRYFNFFKLIRLLQDADISQTSENGYPADIIYALKYINGNFTQEISIGEIAKAANVSINTLERHFQRIFNQSPSSYIRKKRLANAAKLLSEGHSVTEASENSGFSDYSGFIALFGRTYGITPLQYKKNLRRNLGK